MSLANLEREAIPFGIYYEVEDDVVYVYAILDLRAILSGFGNVCGREDRRAFVTSTSDNTGDLLEALVGGWRPKAFRVGTRSARSAPLALVRL